MDGGACSSPQWPMPQLPGLSGCSPSNNLLGERPRDEGTSHDTSGVGTRRGPGGSVMSDVESLQAGLGEAWSANTPGSRTPHVLVALPSFSIGESLLSHYAARIPAMEHRYLVALFILNRIESCGLVFLCSQRPEDAVLDYYLGLLPSDRRDSVRERLQIVAVPNGSGRSVAVRLLKQPKILSDLRDSFAGRLVFIEPWNVTVDEVEVALALNAPINGTIPELWSLGFKSEGRRIFVEAGLPVPAGVEDVRSVDDVLRAIESIRVRSPEARGVVIKHDDSGAGDGNALVRFDEDHDWAVTARATLDALPSWYLEDLQTGGVVEELITGTTFASPSVQVDISPFGEVVVLATHEQVLGGDNGQVYTGCRFPAEPVYVAELGRYGRHVGEVLAQRGAIGRFSVDFAASTDPTGRWSVYGLEINLRKGGTTHPYSVLRHLVPGRYDVDEGRWRLGDGTSRSYSATDNLVDPAWTGLSPEVVIRAVADAGLQFDHESGTGVVLHMLACLAIDGRFGLTAIGRTPEEADRMYSQVRPAVDAAAARSSGAAPAG